MLFKQLTLAFCAASLFTGCVITDGETDTNTDTNATPPNTETSLTGGTTLGTTTDTPTVAGTDTSAEDTTLVTTTLTTTTDATTDATTDTPTTTTDGTTDATTTNTTGPFEPGCGWADRGNYYACAPEGVPGLEDPDMIDPIACKGELVADADCSDMDGPVNSIGCCTPEGVLYFCDAGKIFEQDCNE